MYMSATQTSRCDLDGARERAHCGIIGMLLDSSRVLRIPGQRLINTYSITIHNASWDYEGLEPRHGTRVTALAEKPYFDPKSPTRRQALGLLGPSEIEELAQYA